MRTIVAAGGGCYMAIICYSRRPVCAAVLRGGGESQKDVLGSLANRRACCNLYLSGIGGKLGKLRVQWLQWRAGVHGLV